ncbi:TPA_asm: hypothetical protein GNC10_000767 [Salmonella enterica subsp. salamae serovar 42:z:1,5]|uniref:Uncharacterized protein n=1 Tax=Salmonella enterica subsp. salamae serovar 42:z:1,5 TaxID=1967617 RepID=A0A735PVV4_SALER|nr:hypothetical protein [Salmonella enterica subsp. salamae serovar 42:z:1,5]
MKITQWLKSLVHTEQREMPDMKDIVTDYMVKSRPITLAACHWFRLPNLTSTTGCVHATAWAICYIRFR